MKNYSKKTKELRVFCSRRKLRTTKRNKLFVTQAILIQKIFPGGSREVSGFVLGDCGGVKLTCQQGACQETSSARLSDALTSQGWKKLSHLPIPSVIGIFARFIFSFFCNIGNARLMSSNKAESLRTTSKQMKQHYG